MTVLLVKTVLMAMVTTVQILVDGLISMQADADEAEAVLPTPDLTPVLMRMQSVGLGLMPQLGKRLIQKPVQGLWAMNMEEGDDMLWMPVLLPVLMSTLVLTAAATSVPLPQMQTSTPVLESVPAKNQAIFLRLPLTLASGYRRIQMHFLGLMLMSQEVDEAVVLMPILMPTLTATPTSM
jgi:hypothetical protein